MVKKEDLAMSDHAWLESHADGISRNEIAEAITRGPRVRQNGHFITIYKYFTVVYMTCLIKDTKSSQFIQVIQENGKKNKVHGMRRKLYREEDSI